MSNDAASLPDDPIVLKAMIATLQAENAKISATLRAHDQLVQALRLRIAKLTKQMFGKTSEKIEREIPLGTLLRNTLTGSGTAGTGAGGSADCCCRGRHRP
jgi:transposase